MATATDKSVYVKIWKQINPSNDSFIRTQKTILWIQALLKREQLSSKQAQSTKQGKGKDKKSSNQKELKKNNQKGAQKNKTDSQKNKTDSQIKQKPKNTEQSPNKQPNTQLDNASAIKQQINEQVILSYIKKYSESEQYKLLCKQQQKPVEVEPIKQEKQKKKLSRQASKKLTKKTQPKQPETKYDQNLIVLTYEEAIFFYFWFKKIHQKDFKQRFLQKLKNQQQNYERQQQKLQQNHGPQSSLKPNQTAYQPKHFIQLTERQMSYINEESFVSLKQHQPKLTILFKHYAKLSHLLTKQVFTFEERTLHQKIMSLHQWMVFCKDWNILNAKNINEGWQAGKVTREFLMDVYYKNSFLRKEMLFEMFLRAIISVSCRMYQDCDVYKVKPIDLMLSFLSIKNEQKFIENLETKNISYRHGDILGCFKVKDRDVFEKMNIIRVTGSEKFKKSHFTLLGQRKFGDRSKVKDGQVHEYRMERNSEMLLGKVSSEMNLIGNHQTTNVELHHQGSLEHNYSTGNLSKLSMTRKNRKSAPQIGIKLPRIEENKFFTPVPQNNHLNKFKHYIDNEIPESSSVLRNKITGYHKIHSIIAQEEGEKLGLRNKAEHLKMSKVIGGRIEELMAEGRERVNPEQLEASGSNRV